MTNHTLEEIVVVEKEIQASLAEERRKAVVWLAGERDGIIRDTEAELEEARRQCRLQLAAAEAGVGDEVTTELVGRAEAYAEQLKNLSQERLRTQVSGYLQRLLPEQRR